MLKYVDYDIVFQEIPDEVSLAINISQCPNRCSGCHSMHLMENIGEDLSTDILYRIIDKYKDSITCVCFMGGDKSQPEIEKLANAVKTNYNLTVGCYSGKEVLPKQLYLFDYVKLGRYFAALCGLGILNKNHGI